MITTALRLATAAVLVAACSDGVVEEVSSTGNSHLGIARYQLHETESVLRVVGVDTNGAQVASLRLSLGLVTPPSFAAPTFGRTLELEVQGNRYDDFLSGGMDPLVLPYPTDYALYSFLLDTYVSHQLDRWDIRFQDWPQAEAQDEVAHSGECVVGCSSLVGDFWTPCGGQGAVSSCCQNFDSYYQGYAQYLQAVVCNSGTRMYRMCTYPNGATMCGTAGTYGCANCPGWASGSGGSTTCAGGSNGTCVFQGGGGSCVGLGGSCSTNSQCCNNNCVGGTCTNEF